MLSLNYNLVKKSLIRNVDKKVALFVFLVFFLDLYDMSLFAGYAIYLSPVLLTKLDLYECLPIFATVFAIFQIAKFLGFISYNLSIKSYQFLPLYTISLCYLSLAFFIPYSMAGYSGFVLFVFFRLIQGFALGAEIAFTLKYINSLADQEKNRISWYYFVLLAGEVGILVSIFFNRMLISHGIALTTYEDIWRIQFFFGFLVSILIYYLKHRLSIVYIRSKFDQLCFKYTIVKNWRYILLRSSIIFYTSLLIIIVIIRIPNILELGFKWSHKDINGVVLLVTIIAYIGANSPLILKRFISPINQMMIFYILSIIINIYLWHSWDISEHFYKIWIYTTGFLYGVFLRLTPTVVYSVNDFNHRNRLIGRYISYLIAYTIFVSLVVVSLDYSHYLLHSIHNYVPMLIMILTACIGMIALALYKPYSQRTMRI